MPPWQWTMAFGRARRPRREEDEERVAERDGLEAEWRRLGQELRPRDRAVGRLVVLAVRQVDDRFEAGKPLCDRGHLLAAVDVALAVAVARDGEQHPGLDLREAVYDGARPELRGAARPDRSEARRREEGDERLGDAREIGDDSVAAPDAEPLESRAGPRDLLAQLPERQVERRPRVGTAVHGDARGVGLPIEKVLRVVQACTWEPHRARHLRALEHALIRRGCANPEDSHSDDQKPSRSSTDHCHSSW
jgi:hypothetical protein